MTAERRRGMKGEERKSLSVSAVHAETSRAKWFICLCRRINQNGIRSHSKRQRNTKKEQLPDLYFNHARKTSSYIIVATTSRACFLRWKFHVLLLKTPSISDAFASITHLIYHRRAEGRNNIQTVANHSRVVVVFVEMTEGRELSFFLFSFSFMLRLTNKSAASFRWTRALIKFINLSRQIIASMRCKESPVADLFEGAIASGNLVIYVTF